MYKLVPYLETAPVIDEIRIESLLSRYTQIKERSEDPNKSEIIRQFRSEELQGFETALIILGYNVEEVKGS